MVAGSCLLTFIGLFKPQLPAMRSMSPSPSISASCNRFHQPFKLPGKYWSDRSVNFPFLLCNKCSFVHSPQTIRSFQPSLSISIQAASVTIPSESNAARIVAGAFVKSPFPLLISSKLWGDSGYLPGTTLLPTKMSKSPSLSISATLTHEPHRDSGGNDPTLL